jgi:hypothetical protein
MPEEMAGALGSYFRAGATEWDGRILGLCHGGFVPWNLLRKGRGGVLLDWEEIEEGAPPPPFDLPVPRRGSCAPRPSRRRYLPGSYQPL